MGGQLREKRLPLVAHGLARWTGQHWDYLPQAGAQGLDGDVMAVAVAADGRIYAGGLFERAGSARAHCLARWNGRSWESLPPGCLADSTGSLSIAQLAIAADGQLYAAAYAYSQGPNPRVCRVARWDGRAWHPLGHGLGGNQDANDYPYVRALVPDRRGGVYVGGRFGTAGGLATPNVAYWNGKTWEALGSGLPGSSINALALAPDGTLYAAGEISLRPGYSEQLIMRWDGRSWSQIGGFGNGTNCGTGSSVLTLAVAPGGDLYAGGMFAGVYAARSWVPARHVVRWDGTAWHALVPLNAQETADDCASTSVHSLAFAPTGALYAAGDFAQLGAVAARRVARWDGRAWHALGPGFNGPALTLACAPGGRVVVGGRFTAFGDYHRAAGHFAILDPAACPPAPKQPGRGKHR